MLKSLRVAALLCSIAYAFPVAAADLTAQLLAVEKNPASAITAFGEMVASDDPKQVAAFGVMLFDGTGVPVNHPRAMPFLMKAAAMGRPEAQYRLGLAYTQGSGQQFYGDPPADENQAAQWMTKAAASAAPLADKDPAAMMVLARLKFDGLGGVAKDFDGASALVKKAAERGYPEGQTAYGYLLSKDLRRPVDRNKLHEAINWFAKAAITGSSQALEGIGTTYLGLDEPEKALPFLRRAATLGREPASRFLYLRFGEKIGSNIALEQDKIFDAAAAERRQHELVDTLTDPAFMAVSILALSAIIGLAVTDPNRPDDPEQVKEMEERNQYYREQQAKSYDIVPCITPSLDFSWGVGSCY